MGLADLGLPPRARAYVLSCAGLGAAALVAAGLLAPRGLQGPEALATWAGATLLACVLFVLQVHSPALNRRGKTMGVHLDEGVLLVGFVALPGPVVVLASVAAIVASQAFLRKHPVKAAFNVAVQALSVGAAGLAFAAAVAAGAPILGAAVAIPFVVSVVSVSLVSVLLATLEGEPIRRAFRQDFLASVTLASVAGATFGVLAIGLHSLHPLALALLVPLGFLLRKALVSEYRHQNELTTRRALQRAHDRLVGGSDEDAIVAAGLSACEEALDLLSCEVRSGDRTWRVEHRPPAGPTRVVAAPLVNAEGRRSGELRATVAWNGALRLQEDEETVALLASSLSMALATADALRSLREARRGLEDVLDAAGEPIVAWDPEGRVVHANEAAKALLGESGPEGVARRLDPASAEAFLRAMRTAPHERAEVEAWTLSGRALEMRKGPITLAGRGVGTLLVARDVTERRRLESEAAEHREAMARAERFASLGILAAGVAHEINSPLMYIQGNLEMTGLDLEEIDPKGRDERVVRGREQLATALGGVERIRRITHGLGVLGRPERARPAWGSDLNDALRRGVEEARRKSPEASPALEEALHAEPLAVDADPSDLRQIAFHLVRNAMEAAGASGRVRTTTRREGDHAELVVEDDGPGVAPEDRPKLFTPFFTTKPDGTGLGLPIALALARSMGGDVTHEPRPGGGAVFRARFPLRPAASRDTRRLLTADG